jgi:uncharacterized radical SAM superfamily protein
VSWYAATCAVEALEPAALDEALVARMQAAGAGGPIAFHTPSFKRYSSSEIAASRSPWPSISITGAQCSLQCDHCKARILEPMIPATTPEALWREVNEQIARGARGMLLTGGSNHRDEVEYGPFLPTVRRIKDAHPGFRIACHTALVDRAMASALEEAGIDVAMLDIIGAQDTVQQVYHLKRPVADFEAALAHLVATRMKIVPHIVIGLHYGRLLGEWQALEMIARQRPDALVLVVAMPIYAGAQRPFAVPASVEIGRFFLEARAALAGTPVLLGCARPAGRAKMEVDAYAVMAGLDGIAHPADGAVELALRIGREVSVMASCCSIAVDDDAPLIDFRKVLEEERVKKRFPVPVVAA